MVQSVDVVYILVKYRFNGGRRELLDVRMEAFWNPTDAEDVADRLNRDLECAANRTAYEDESWSVHSIPVKS